MIEDFLSEYGKVAFIPNGFTTQSEECLDKKVKINATAGVYQVKNKIKTINEISSQFTDLTDKDIVQYASAMGYKPLRETWKRHIFNSSFSKNVLDFEFNSNYCSLPVVTNGISNALYTAGSLFINKDDEVFIPKLHWDAYDSIFKYRLGGNLVTYDNFDLHDLESNLNTNIGKKIIVLNYPNNPTGYTLTFSDVNYLEFILAKRCKLGDKIIIILDDAYMEYFYEKCYDYSLFEDLGNISENLIVAKCDGVSKEYCAWGMRIGFITFKSKGIVNPLVYSLLEHKAAAVNRGTLSSIAMDNQVLINRAIKINEHAINDIFIDLKERFNILNNSISKYSNDALKVLPHNSGYFVCFETNGVDAEELRQTLLNKRSIGIIRYDDKHIRVAFSSVDKEDIPILIKTLYYEASKLKLKTSSNYSCSLG